MNIWFSEKALWVALFFGLVIGYCLYYAPYGVNETDGGFLTGLAWQVLNGKVLYQDVVYVRPPLPVWLRALELQLLPEHLGVLGERWIFYLKLGMYSWLGAALLETGARRWVLAVFGFVVSAHCYPAMAWHTVDGILFAVLSVYLAFKPIGRFTGWWAATGGAMLFAAVLCKQSFYPLVFIFGLGLLYFDWRRASLFYIGFSAALLLFAHYLHGNNLLESYLQMTNGAAAGGQAFQHGIIDYFRITPELAVPSLALAGLGVWQFRKKQVSNWPMFFLRLWLLALVLSFAAVTWLRQEHTVPFAQLRALFLLALWMIVWHWIEKHKSSNTLQNNGLRSTIVAAILLGISWSAAISWGYNLPILFATPVAWGAMQLYGKLSGNAGGKKTRLDILLLLALLAAFRLGFEFVYRDGRRSAMTAKMGVVFPKLTGIYSSPETQALYQELKELTLQHGPNFSVLPAFPQANYLTDTRPPLPLDWVVNRETNGDNKLIYNMIKEYKPLIFIEKAYLEKMPDDPELSFTKDVMAHGEKLVETEHFLVIRPAQQ